MKPNQTLPRPPPLQELTVLVWEVVADMLLEEGLDGLADVLLLIGYVVVVLSVVPLADP